MCNIKYLQVKFETQESSRRPIANAILFSMLAQLMRRDIFVDREVLVPRRTEGIEHGRVLDRFNTVGNITGEII
jgi:hypothetical protein